ncbi:MAG: hypothetical protein LUG16_05240, partial [Candidatus Gastranaerophilales bacterium]|nr:hypothetical protein [Candidatus Gastranaerophilales bacterium]
LYLYVFLLFTPRSQSFVFVNSCCLNNNVIARKSLIFAAISGLLRFTLSQISLLGFTPRSQSFVFGTPFLPTQSARYPDFIRL